MMFKVAIALLALVAAAYGQSSQGCSSHAQCSSPVGYCDTSGVCYPCSFCTAFNDAVDGNCPNPCATETAQFPTFTVAGDEDDKTILFGADGIVTSTPVTTIDPLVEYNITGPIILGLYQFDFFHRLEHIDMTPNELRNALQTYLRSISTDQELTISSVAAHEDDEEKTTIVFTATNVGGIIVERRLEADMLEFFITNSLGGDELLQEDTTSFQTLNVNEGVGSDDVASTSNGGSSTNVLVPVLCSVLGAMLLVGVAVLVVFMRERNTSIALDNAEIALLDAPTAEDKAIARKALFDFDNRSKSSDDVLASHENSAPDQVRRSASLMAIPANRRNTMTSGIFSLESVVEADCEA